MKLSSRVPYAPLMTALIVKPWSCFYLICSMMGEMVGGLLNLHRIHWKPEMENNKNKMENRMETKKSMAKHEEFQLRSSSPSLTFKQHYVKSETDLF